AEDIRTAGKALAILPHPIPLPEGEGATPRFRPRHPLRWPRRRSFLQTPTRPRGGDRPGAHARVARDVGAGDHRHVAPAVHPLADARDARSIPALPAADDSLDADGPSV